jgi:hypothetical protein
LAVVTARRDLLTRQLGMTQAVIKVLESAVSKKQASEAHSSKWLAQIAEAKVQGKHPIVQLVSSENTAFADELASVVSAQGDLARQLASAEQRLQRLEGDYQGAQQRVALAGLSSALGQVLVSNGARCRICAVCVVKRVSAKAPLPSVDSHSFVSKTLCSRRWILLPTSMS